MHHVIGIVGGFQVLKYLIQQNVQTGQGDKKDNFAVSILADGGSISSKDYKACVDHDLVVQTRGMCGSSPQGY